MLFQFSSLLRFQTNFFSIFFLGIPLAVAGQHIVAATCTVCIFALNLMQKVKCNKEFYSNLNETKSYFVFLFLFLSTLFVSNLANSYGRHSPIHFWGGYLVLLFLPTLFFGCAKATKDDLIKNIERAIAIAVVFMGIVAMSQHIWPWKLEAGSIVSDTGRARGLFSHPLTFAYVNVILYPWAIYKFTAYPHWKTGFVLIANLSTIIFSQSKTIQFLAILYMFFHVVHYASPRVRMLLVAVCAILFGALFFTKNPFSKRYHEILSSSQHDRQSPYMDDRLAFWDVHWLMLRERPFFGHGTEMDDNYRLPYYEKRGLGQMNKHYEAHNMLLQVLAEGGLVGFLFFASWYAWLLAYALSKYRERKVPRYFFDILLLFLFAGLTQNAIQDAEVRYTLALVICLMLIQALNDESRIPLKVPIVNIKAQGSSKY